ncbi:hypothetical protein HELRODRAFT_182792 [Helobdella robusta]|uniref:Uncharacterized protein n=1 Tax=Helobdella robusta TaxID=6412 RepID=T1FIR0_HELRO|nr:hypothetical protein HELRODRAFT_182792 [Helobdella robusta]ESN90098.1 hypothetical protein HELRODRAFT_182792 [Helobdella robusta]
MYLVLLFKICFNCKEASLFCIGQNVCLRQNRVILPRHNRTCGMSTTLTLTSNKQAFSCDGTPGNKNACGRRYLPEVGQTTLPLFIKSINFDSTFVGNYDQSCTQQYQNQLQSPEHQQPSSSLENQHSSHKPSQHHLLQQNDQLNQNIDRHFMYQQRKQQNKLINNYHHYQHKQQHYHEFQHPFNYITLEGSYYVAYLKVAQCQPARATRTWGHEPKIRTNPHSSENSKIIIADPMQSNIVDDVITAFHYYAKTTSIQHVVYFQVWRPQKKTTNKRLL